jgi:transposase
MGKGASSEKVVREIHRRTRRRFSAEEKIRIILDGLRGEESIAELVGLREHLRQGRPDPRCPSATVACHGASPSLGRSRSTRAHDSLDSRYPLATTSTTLRPSFKAPMITNNAARPCR